MLPEATSRPSEGRLFHTLPADTVLELVTHLNTLVHLIFLGGFCSMTLKLFPKNLPIVHSKEMFWAAAGIRNHK